ncbi:MAG: LysM peptidoglycan-binding domain-containing protein [Candidatus Marinimicrobia bacterium]|nr:LysM peptidoglycan-binding domain-containing protein [Candidatus Neomarinimicrobiota bacterium]MCF7850417.1 LysM peptidoglycan-binding domain-containing protein [Candidatus Neomarinimicrobiota bacterium]MCF7905012.1 LysM peptidoglycan-binding domain-containing protein [Candidatus Neomarinimicrobiota bacterium]
MSAPKNILSIYQDGVELKTVLAGTSKGKIVIKAIDHATLISPFQQEFEEDVELDEAGEPLESPDDIFGIDNSGPLATDDLGEAVSAEEEEASGSMVDETIEEQFDEDETNEDILHTLLTHVPEKRYAHAINLPRNLAHTLHLRTDYSQMKPKEREKKIFNEIVERLNDTVIPKDHYDSILTPSGDAYSFVYKNDIPIIHAFDSIQQYLKVKPRFVSVTPDEVALVNLLRYNYEFEAEEVITLVNIEDVQSSFIIMQGNDVLHFSQSIRENLKSPSLLNAVTGRMLYDQDLGHFPDSSRIILTGEAPQINAKEHFVQTNPGVNVEYFQLNAEKFVIPEELDATFTGYAVPLGMAVQALLPKLESHIPINLIPDYVKQRQRTFKLAWHGMLLLLLIFLTPIGINHIYQQKLDEQRAAQLRISNLNQSIKDIDWVTYMVDSLSLEHASVQEQLHNLTKLSQGSLRWSVTFKQLLVALEEVNGVWFADLKSKGEGIELAGLSLYRNRIPRLIEYFEEAEISTVIPADIRGKTVYKFTLSINSITADSAAFNPKLITPPPMPIESLEASAPVTIIDENEDIQTPPDTLEVIEPEPEPEPEPQTPDTMETDPADMEQLADSLLPEAVFDSLMPMTDDISRLSDSLENVTTQIVSEPSMDGNGGIPITALKVHKVRRGETLKKIARDRLGDEKRWREIYNLNRDVLSSPNKLSIGQILVVLQDEEDLDPIKHKVKPNENLKILALWYYGDEERWEKLYELNKHTISNPNIIYPGQELTIMSYDNRFNYPLQTHVIRSGETLKTIARKYLGDEARWEEIMQLNPKSIKDPNRIFKGQRIKVRNEVGK